MTLLITRYDRKKLNNQTEVDCHSPEKDGGVGNRPELVEVIVKK